MPLHRLPGCRFLFIVFAVAAASLPVAAARAGVDIKHMMKIDPPARILDTTASTDGKLIFVLTSGEIYIYTGVDGKILDRISVDKKFVRLTPLDESRVILFGNDPPILDILKIDRVYDINTAGRAFKGAENAPVVLAVFDDYQCPYCSRLQPELERLVQKYSDRVKLVIKHFPIPSHRFASLAALAALAAGNQGKFWEFHAALLQNYETLDEQKIRDIAQNLGLDMVRFEKDLDSPESRALILEDLEEGRNIDVRGTPTIFLNGKSVDNRDFRKLPEMIDELLSKKK